VTTLQKFIWEVLPYVAIAVFVVGMFWRYKYDRFGWTTRSSQMYESRLLRLGSPLFHFGILLALGGHVIGLVIPEAWTDAAGISEDLYHAVAVTAGSIAAVMVVTGLAILVYRRRTVGPVFRVTTRSDKAMYLVLGSVVLLGAFNTLGINLFDITGEFEGGYNYRESVAEWFRSIFWFNPDGEAMVSAPLSFRMHAMAALVLIAMIPFTRLVHVFSAPIGYLSRPAVVYRSKDAGQLGSRDPLRGWEPVSRR
jgi:nitrate reductase gamma subunit